MLNKEQIVVILAGGKGKRLWPASTEACPKHFLDLNGNGKSLIQETYKRVESIFPSSNIFVSCNQKQVALIKEHLPSMPDDRIIAEPISKNTASAIYYTFLYLKAINPNANVLIVPCDHRINNLALWQKETLEAFRLIQEDNTPILFGITPTFQCEHYGHIEVGRQQQKNLYQIKQFVEKPNLEASEKWVSGTKYLWNSGSFLFAIPTILKAFQEYAPEIVKAFKPIEHNLDDKGQLLQAFNQAPAISFDYAIMEKGIKSNILKVNFDWSDLGTWNELYRAGKKDKNENVFIYSTNIELYDSTKNIIFANKSNHSLALNGIHESLILITAQKEMVINLSEL